MSSHIKMPVGGVGGLRSIVRSQIPCLLSLRYMAEVVVISHDERISTIIPIQLLCVCHPPCRTELAIALLMDSGESTTIALLAPLLTGYLEGSVAYLLLSFLVPGRWETIVKLVPVQMY